MFERMGMKVKERISALLGVVLTVSLCASFLPYQAVGVPSSDADAPLAVTVQAGGAESYAHADLPSGTPPYQNHIVDGVSPNGTTINLFDYWITNQNDSDNSDPAGILNR